MDPMGRKVWQTVWVETEGSDTGWNNPLAAGDSCVYPAQWDETTTNCLSWEFIGKRRVCMEYEVRRRGLLGRVITSALDHLHLG